MCSIAVTTAVMACCSRISDLRREKRNIKQKKPEKKKAPEKKKTEEKKPKKEEKEKERISTELNMAKQIQASTLPNVFPPFPDRHEFDLYASMDTAKEVGGDFYDFFLIDEDHLCLVMADMSGKGVPAALFMMKSRAIIRSSASPGRAPGIF